MEKTLHHIVREILNSYDSVPGLNNTDKVPLPSRRAVGQVCEHLLQILLPGFHDDEDVHGSSLGALTFQRIAGLGNQFEKQIARVFTLEERSQPQKMAEVQVMEFLEVLPRIREQILTDVEAAFHCDPAATRFEEIVISYPGIKALAIQRMAHVLYVKKVPMIPRMMTEWANDCTGIDLHPGAQIGNACFINHGTGVVVGETCVIGTGVKLYHGVTLGGHQPIRGGQSQPKSKRHPTVGDQVTLYPYATILGGETVIGAGSTVGAHVVLLHSVPSNSLVIQDGGGLQVMAKESLSSEQKAEWSRWSV